MRHIEVELRGPLSEEQYIEFIAVLRTHGKHLGVQNRFLLDYSTFLEGIGGRKTDVRTRVTNGRIELIVKKGAFGGTAREEASVYPEGDLPSALRFMSLLGYTKAIACDRGIDRYEIDGMEVAVQDVREFTKPGVVHSRFFEIEIMATEEEKEAAVEKIRVFMSAHNLSEYTPEAWYAYIEQTNAEGVNGVFEYGVDDIERVRELGQAS